MALNKLRSELRRCSSKKQAETLQWFFKTGPGEYAEGDKFIGVKVPHIRAAAKRCADISLVETAKLLKSKIHEERLAALLILVAKYAKANDSDKVKIYTLYLKHTKYINNWDLVDLSAYHIVGAFLVDKSRKPLCDLAQSNVLWERRIAMIATYQYIKHNDFHDACKVARLLLHDTHDLIHKAVGWMLREVGKRDLTTEETFLKKHYKTMPRTMLRYAIERFPGPKRQAYLKGRI
ncbi:DNA alkylation repair protein [Candidatus Omnitrophota bacterium]